MKMLRLFRHHVIGLFALAAALAGVMPEPVYAHGERAMEPYIRTRTTYWYDVKWSTDKVGVNDTLTVTGKVRLARDWPDAVSRPDMIFLSAVAPGAVFTRVESYLDGEPAQQSIQGLELGRDYEAKVVLKGRIPGRWHVHPAISVDGAGTILGPGSWVEITGSAADFKAPITTLTGVEIDDIQTYGVARAQLWQLGFGLLALAWLVWWLRRPLIIPRILALKAKREDLLITPLDEKVSVGVIVGLLLLTIVGYRMTTAEFPYLVPLQAGSVKFEPRPEPASTVRTKLTEANYDVPGRSMRLSVDVTNNGDRPVRVGEFLTAQLRFLNHDLEHAADSIDPSYPKELIPGAGLIIDDDTPIQPGETRSLHLEATDAAWETERLVSFLNDIDSRIGGVIFTYDDQGKRNLSELSGSIVPHFSELSSVADGRDVASSAQDSSL